jgi:hypothetical protein
VKLSKALAAARAIANRSRTHAALTIVCDLRTGEVTSNYTGPDGLDVEMLPTIIARCQAKKYDSSTTEEPQ